MSEEKKIRGLDKMEPDKEMQFEKQLSDVEKLIFKPHNIGLENLTEQEVKQYISLDAETLRDNKINNKTFIIFEETKKYIIKHMDEIIGKIKKKQSKEEDYER